MLCTLRSECNFIGVSLNGFVIYLVSFQPYVEVVHFDSLKVFMTLSLFSVAASGIWHVVSSVYNVLHIVCFMLLTFAGVRSYCVV
jgi:hypothetical protein